MNKKKLFKYIAGLFVLVVLVAPRVAQAATASEVQDIAAKAFRLCAADPEKYKNSCTVSQEFNTVAKAAAKLPEDKQAAYIKKELPKFSSTQSAVNRNYLAAVQDGKINSEGDATVGSSYSGTDTCGDVKVSIDVGCPDDSSINPIYAYLRGIIIFIGGAIGLAVVISIIVAGIQYSSSNGNPQNIAKAKERIINAVIGLLLYLFLAAIIRYLIPQVFS